MSVILILANVKSPRSREHYYYLSFFISSHAYLCKNACDLNSFFFLEFVWTNDRTKRFSFFCLSFFVIFFISACDSLFFNLALGSQRDGQVAGNVEQQTVLSFLVCVFFRFFIYLLSFSLEARFQKGRSRKVRCCCTYLSV